MMGIGDESGTWKSALAGAVVNAFFAYLFLSVDEILVLKKKDHLFQEEIRKLNEPMKE